MHRIGDVVRLNRGWTPMIVLHIEDNGELWAVYASRDNYYPITEWHYKNYREAYSYHRHHTGFTEWDGKPIIKEWNYLMSRRYRFIKQPHIVATYVGITAQGNYILEFPNGSVSAYPLADLEEDFPNTFSVKSFHNNHKTTYQVPEVIQNIQVNDVLVSDSGNLYIVTAIDTKNPYPKGIFKGRRIITERL